MDPFKIALGEYGVKEIVGSKHNPRVVEYFAKAGHPYIKDDETSWCAAFVGFCLETAGIASTKKLNARSYLEWGEKAVTPSIGDIIVLWRVSPGSWEGHVGFYIGTTPTGVLILGGNQANQVYIAEYPKNQILGYRKNPFTQNTCEISGFTTHGLFAELGRRLGV